MARNTIVVAAVLSFVYEMCIGHTLEFVKVAMQTGVYGNSYGAIIRSITNEKGWFGLLDGFFPFGALQAVCKGISFSAGFEFAKHVLHMQGSFGKRLVAGGFGGFVQGWVLSPLLLVKTKIMTDASMRNNGGNSVFTMTVNSIVLGKKIVLQGGILDGAFLFSIKRVLDWTTRYYFSELLEKLWSRDKLSPGKLLLCGIMAGILSATVTMPLDILVSIVQKASTNVELSLAQVVRMQIANASWHSMTKGFIARCLHVIFTTILMRQIVPMVASDSKSKTD